MPRLVTNQVKSRVKRRRKELIDLKNVKSFQLYADLRGVPLKGLVNFVLKDWMSTIGLGILEDMFDKVALNDLVPLHKKSCNPFHREESDIATPTKEGDKKRSECDKESVIVFAQKERK